MDRAANPASRFTAALEPTNNNLGWVIARVPARVSAKLGGRGQIRVRGTISAAGSASAAFSFSTTLFPDGKRGHYLLVNKAMQAGGRVRVGHAAEISLQLDHKKRTVTVPPELNEALSEDRQLLQWFKQSLTPSQRRDIARWIADPKSADARRRRAEQLAERLMLTMEAEQELPPALRIAMARDHRAAEGWKLASPTQRRAALLAIFYYRSPDAQARRIAKVMEEMITRFEKRSASQP